MRVLRDVASWVLFALSLVVGLMGLVISLPCEVLGFGGIGRVFSFPFLVASNAMYEASKELSA